MSSFKGRMRLYTNICIDRFDGKNLKCTAFFLSHCHKDHMAGLDDEKFKTALLSRPGVFLYCSEITRLLLLADEEYRPLEASVRVLEVGTRHLVKVPKDHVERGGCDIAVTPISAGHCPGSVMFLFEGDHGTCLYTGDFRWESNYASTVAAFRSSDSLKEIDHLYIDTTFCVPAALHIPSRVECAEVTVAIVAAWLKRSPLHQVAFFCPARYGYEFLLRELATRIGIKIHVSATKFSLYEQIPDLSGLFTSDPMGARVHACCPKLCSNASSVPPCLSRGSTKSKKEEKSNRSSRLVLNIRPCAMWFTTKMGRAALERLTPSSPRGLQRVCYSMHSSYSEIRDLVSYLQPSHVWPNVIPASDHGPEHVQERLNSFLEKSHPLRPKQVKSEKNQIKAEEKSFDLLNKRRPTQVLSLFRFVRNDSESSDGCVFDSEGSTRDKTAEPDRTDAEQDPRPEQFDVLQLGDMAREAEEQPVLCPGVLGEEADSDLHLKLSLDSDSDTSQGSDVSQEFEDKQKNPLHEDVQPTCDMSQKNIGHPNNTRDPCQYKKLSLRSLKDPDTTLNTKWNSQCRSGSQVLCQEGATEAFPDTVDSTSACERERKEGGVIFSSSECQKEEANCDDVPSNKQKTVLGGNSDLSAEDDSDVIDSSPVSKTKRFTSLLKGRSGKAFSNMSCPEQNFHCPLSSGCHKISPHCRQAGKQHDFSPPGNTKHAVHGSRYPQVFSTVKRRIFNTDQSDSVSDIKNERNDGNSQTKRQRLNPVHEPEHRAVSDSVTTEQEKQGAISHPGQILEKNLDKEGELNHAVYVVPSDSEETDEDSEKLLKPLSKSDLKSTGTGINKNHSKFIDLTKDT